MTKSYPINSEASKIAFYATVDKLYQEHKYITFSAPRIGADRSLSSNALSHCWYNYADKMLSEQIGTSRNFCKLHFGIPILRAEDNEFRVMYGQVIMSHAYETKLSIMKYLPVTSLMSREQMARYLTAVQVHYAENHGLVLESKGEFAKHQRQNAGG